MEVSIFRLKVGNDVQLLHFSGAAVKSQLTPDFCQKVKSDIWRQIWGGHTFGQGFFLPLTVNAASTQ